MQAHCIGALIVDSDGAILHASGLARTANIQQLLRSRLASFASTGSDRTQGLSVKGEWHPIQIHRCHDSTISLVFPAVAKGGLVDARDCDELDEIIGNSAAIAGLKDEIRRVAPKDVNVLLVGESGTGKELVARSIHNLSKRRAAPYVAVNAAALPASLFESEFFGYATGAFTGADRRGRQGRLEQAHTGTLFLDEIGDMSTEVQVKLLRVLQDGRFERLGNQTSVHSDFRLISATHRDMGELVREKQFRLDMFYRIGAVTLRLPPLRERLSDIPSLVEALLLEFSRKHGVPPLILKGDACAYLMSQKWPGNVRQLRHEVEKAAIFADGCEIDANDFRLVQGSHLPTDDSIVPLREASTVRQAIDEVEISMIREALKRYDGNKRRAAAALGISRGYLYKRLSQKQSDAIENAPTLADLSSPPAEGLP